MLREDVPSEDMPKEYVPSEYVPMEVPTQAGQTAEVKIAIKKG